MKTYAVLILAAGQSNRFGDPLTKKTFAFLDNRPVWMHSVQKFLNRPEVKQLILVVGPDDRAEFQKRFAANLAFLELELVEGGAERFNSVENGLKKVRSDIDFVAIHDAARPCICAAWIDDVFQAAEQTGAAILAAPITGTIKKVEPSNLRITDTVSRENLWEAQTPQVFRRDLIFEAYEKRGALGPELSQPTDDAQLVQQLGHDVQIVPCERMNLKITTKSDLKLAEQILPILPKPKLGF